MYSHFMLSFKPKQVNKNLLLVLPSRTRDIVVSRFGLGKDSNKRTLESIGQQYGITRERVRQIENFALNSIKKSSAHEVEKESFDELKNTILSLGGVLAEEDLLNELSKDLSTQNHVHFMLVLGDDFERMKEDQNFNHRWCVDHEISNKVHQVLQELYSDLSTDDLIMEQEIIDRFVERLSGVSDKYKKDVSVLKRWLNISKVIGKNQLGEWGLSLSPNIRARGVRDYAYLVIRRHGSPLHFTEVAKSITELFDRDAHVATCHNELIKDKARFVLVGRGLYGLTEWGYSNGVVRDVIIKLLKEHGPLSREDLIDKVLKERHVKANTVIVNLQNKKYFNRKKDGMYSLS